MPGRGPRPSRGSLAGVTHVLACRGLLFDVDGTLVDSRRATREAWAAVARELGADADVVAEASLHARAAELVERYFAPERHGEATERSLLAQVASGASVEALPGAHALLTSLPADAWAVVTSGRHAIMAARLAGAGLPVPAAVVSSESVARGKPAPDPYLAGAAALGVDADACVAFEDTPQGVASAHAAGARVVGVAGDRPAADMLAAGATVVVADLTAVRALRTRRGLRVEVDA